MLIVSISALIAVPNAAIKKQGFFKIVIHYNVFTECFTHFFFLSWISAIKKHFILFISVSLNCIPLQCSWGVWFSKFGYIFALFHYRVVFDSCSFIIRVPKVPFCVFDKWKNEIQNFIFRFCFHFNMKNEIQIIDYHFYV